MKNRRRNKVELKGFVFSGRLSNLCNFFNKGMNYLFAKHLKSLLLQFTDTMSTVEMSSMPSGSFANS